MGLENEDSKPSRKGKHLSKEERIRIEVLHREGLSAAQIGERIGRPDRTIRRELRRGWTTLLTGRYSARECYNADRGQTIYEQRMKAKGRKPTKNDDLFRRLHDHIVVKKHSPEVAAALMKREGFGQAVCFKTIYNLIDRGLVPGVNNESLWQKRNRKKKHKHLHRNRKRPVKEGHSIEDRPKRIERRKEVGHWEIDLVVGGKGGGKAVLLTLLERKTRKQLIRKLPDRSQGSVLGAINAIERKMGIQRFRTVFKSITADNGSEFLDHDALERSRRSGKKRTHIYYAHPYSSWERGSNENANRMIRRFVPKGSDISKLSWKQVREIEEWINNYPRGILDFETAEERFNREMGI